MRDWSPERLAEAAGARVARGPAGDGGPVRAVIDSRAVQPGDLFVGLRGQHVDGSAFADQALAAGAWGVLVGNGVGDFFPGGGAVLQADDPLAALQRLATAWRRELGAQVIGITGSTGKTSTKDLTAAMVAQQRSTVATRENLNTEIGLPLTVLAAPPGTEVLVLEMAMRGPGQIAELAEIAEPDVAVITNIGPVHLQQLGSLEAIAAEKGSLMQGLRGGTAVLPAAEPLLDPHVPDGVRVVTFGDGGDVAELPDGLRLPFSSRYMRTNALAALAAARAVGVEPAGELQVALSRLRGERHALEDGTVVVDDCYNANPMSMRAALDDLAATAPDRAVAVLGDMLELGPQELRFHRELGEHAARAGVAELVTAGPLAAEAAQAFADASGRPAHPEADAAAAAERAARVVRPGDTVLVKASRGVGLEVVAQRLRHG